MNKKIVLLCTALSITCIPQKINAAKPQMVIALGVTILGIFGITYVTSRGISDGIKTAQYNKEQADVALITNVEMITTAKFDDTLHVIQESKKNNTNTMLTLAHHLATKEQSIKNLKNELFENEQINKQKVEILSKNVILWEACNMYNKKFIERARTTINKLELSKKLQAISYLHTLIQQEEVFLTSSKFLFNIKDKSYNYDDLQFPTIEAMRAMHNDCEKAGSLLKDLQRHHTSRFYDENLRIDLIEALRGAQQNLQVSIRRIASSSDYKIEKIKKEKYESEKEHVAIEKARAEAQRDQEKERLLRQQRYQEQTVSLRSENRKLTHEKETLTKKLDQEKEKTLRLQREIDRLNREIGILKQELAILKSKSEQDTQNITAIEQKITALQEKVEELVRKLKNPPFNPNNETITAKVLHDYNIRIISNFEAI